MSGMQEPREPQASSSFQGPRASPVYPNVTGDFGRPVIYTSQSTESEPFFEYAIYQKTWGQNENEADIPAIELTCPPLTNLDGANAHAEKLFKTYRDDFAKYHPVTVQNYSRFTGGDGCNTLLTYMVPVDYPRLRIFLKIWVQRNFVGGNAPSAAQNHFISRKVYILRLEGLVDLGTERGHVHVRCPLPANREIFTDLRIANRAAFARHVELCDPTVAEMFNLQVDLTTLDELIEAGAPGFWKSTFRGPVGELYGCDLRLAVEEVLLAGPRNL